MATRNDIEKFVSAALGAGPTESKVAVLAVFEAIKRSLAEGEAVKIQGFGTFEPEVRPPATVRNPATGEPTRSPRRGRVRFRPSQETLEYVAGRRRFPKGAITTLDKVLAHNRDLRRASWERTKARLGQRDE